MGYRSDVAYTIRFNGKANELLEDVEKSFKLFLAEAKVKPETAGCFGDHDNLYVNEDKLELNFYCEDAKWYSSYDDVKCHEELISLAREWVDGGNKFIGVVFCRIGEELGDMQMERDGNYDYEWISLQRSIDLDWTTLSRKNVV